jgi:hypothetical protein
MQKRQTAPRVQIPTLLADSVKNKRAILFLGAGASKEAKNAANQTPPDADQLRDILAARFFAQPMKARDVMAVAEMAIANSAGTGLVFDAVRQAFESFQPSVAHKLISAFNWRHRDHQLRSARRKGLQRLPAASADPGPLRQRRPADRGKITGHPLSGSLSQITRLPRPHPRSRYSVNPVA